MKKDEPIILEHSKAKIELYRKYLAVYLNILSRAQFINKIFLFDLFCGEGKDANGEKGSPLVAVETIKHHYFSNNKTCPNIDILFNDSEFSKIEPKIKRIDRVKRFVQETKSIPLNVSIEYQGKDIKVIQPAVISTINGLKSNERALAFIDPFGYKDIEPSFLKQFLINERSEILLFLPINSMSRFANKAVKDEDFPGGRPLRKLILELMGKEGKNITFKSDMHFIDVLKSKLKEFCECQFSDTFTIERSKNHYFCLFFLGNNKKGLQKILEAKWELNKDNGRGFEIRNEGQASFFSNEVLEVSNYPKLLKEFIISKSFVTNVELFDFGIINGHLPKHTRDSLKYLQDQGMKLNITSTDGSTVRKNSYYISDNPEKIIKISKI